MLLKDPFKRIFLFLWIFILLFSLSALSQAEAADDISWKKLDTKYASIRYQTEEDLKAYNQKTKSPKEISASGINSLFSNSEPMDYKEELKQKIDTIFKSQHLP